MNLGNISIIISLIALVASFFTILVLYRNRLETNRPIVTVLLESNTGNIATPLTLRVYNTGYTPALDVTLSANEEDIINALDEKVVNKYKTDVYKCLSKENMIPIIHNGANVSYAFGILSENESNTFKLKSKIPIVIKYKSLYGHSYKQKQILIIQITDNFAGSGWSK
ncbi:MAG: hypothetical protein KAH72_09660 [Flavobacteriaceae bacterium]|nr:hypothetical protein [Flavobacteriaceae bacterium]